MKFKIVWISLFGMMVWGATSIAASPIREGEDELNRRAQQLMRVLTLPDGWEAHGDSKNVPSTLLAYFKNRTSVQHPALQTPTVVSARDLKWANDAVNHIFVGQPDYPSFFRGEKIDWRSPAVPDKEWLVQFHRMYYWRAMARVYSDTGDDHYVQAWSDQLIDWVRNNPNDKEHRYAWRILEVGKRGNSWAENYFRFIRSPNFNEETLIYLLDSLYEHAQMLLHAKQRPESNWELMMAEGLAAIGLAFPEFSDAKMWRKQGAARLVRAMKKQVYADGHQRELCMGYHIGSITWLSRTLDFATLNGFENLFPASYDMQLAKMVDVPLKLCLPDGTNVQFGDTTCAGEPGQYQALYHKWATATGRSDFLFLATDGKEGHAPAHTAYALANSGLYSMRSGWDRDAICLVMKCGPDGGFHSQPDNGTFDVYAGGRNLMPDSGSYTYSSIGESKKWRQWFRQTKVHQTLTLNGKNSRYDAALTGWKNSADLDVISVENQSYENLKHRRTVYFVEKRFFVILDEAIGSAGGDVDLHFQLAPGDPVVDPSAYTFRSNFEDGWNVWVRTEPQTGLEFASEEGWVSYVYTQKEERPAFRYRLKKSAQESLVRFVTVVAPYASGVPAIQARLVTTVDGTQLVWIEHGRQHRLPSVAELNVAK